MKHRVTAGVVIMLAMGWVCICMHPSGLLAGEPGEKAKGPQFKTKGYLSITSAVTTWTTKNFPAAGLASGVPPMLPRGR